jgi:hypothetical protein
VSSIASYDCLGFQCPNCGGDGAPFGFVTFALKRGTHAWTCPMCWVEFSRPSDQIVESHHCTFTDGHPSSPMRVSIPLGELR